MFRAAVPTRVRVESCDDDLEQLEHDVVLHLDVVDGRLVCTKLEVSMTPGGASVTADALRRIPVGRLLREAAASGLNVFEVDADDERSTRPFVPPPRHFAAGGMNEEVLKEVARLYHWALATGDAPLGLLERDYGIPRERRAGGSQSRAGAAT